jgi:hypothetical protein
MSAVSLVFGIFSIIFIFTGPFSIIGLVFGTTGIALAAAALRKGNDGIAIGGLVTSLVGTGITLMLYLACIACLTGTHQIMKDASKTPGVQGQWDDFTKKLKELEKSSQGKKSL